jgi:hypothetical protein
MMAMIVARSFGGSLLEFVEAIDEHAIVIRAAATRTRPHRAGDVFAPR